MQVGIEQRARADEAVLRQHGVDQREVVASRHPSAIEIAFAWRAASASGSRPVATKPAASACDGRLDQMREHVVRAGRNRQQRRVAPAARERAIRAVAAERDHDAQPASWSETARRESCRARYAVRGASTASRRPRPRTRRSRSARCRACRARSGRCARPRANAPTTARRTIACFSWLSNTDARATRRRTSLPDAGLAADPDRSPVSSALTPSCR